MKRLASLALGFNLFVACDTFAIQNRISLDPNWLSLSQKLFLPKLNQETSVSHSISIPIAIGYGEFWSHAGREFIGNAGIRKYFGPNLEGMAIAFHYEYKNGEDIYSDGNGTYQYSFHSFPATIGYFNNLGIFFLGAEGGLGPAYGFYPKTPKANEWNLIDAFLTLNIGLNFHH